jgi:hypothetical protein
MVVARQECGVVGKGGWEDIEVNRRFCGCGYLCREDGLEVLYEDGRGLEVVVGSFHWTGEKSKRVRG